MINFGIGITWLPSKSHENWNEGPEDDVSQGLLLANKTLGPGNQLGRKKATGIRRTERIFQW